MGLLFHARCDGALTDEFDTYTKYNGSTMVAAAAAHRYGPAGARVTIVNSALAYCTKALTPVNDEACGFWLRVNTPQQNDKVMTILRVASSGATYVDLRLRSVGALLYLAPYIGTATNWQYIIDAAWHYVQCVYDANGAGYTSYMTLYVDGVQVAQAGQDIGDIAPAGAPAFGTPYVSSGVSSQYDMDELKIGDTLADVPAKNAKACRANYYAMMARA